MDFKARTYNFILSDLIIQYILSTCHYLIKCFKFLELINGLLIKTMFSYEVYSVSF